MDEGGSRQDGERLRGALVVVLAVTSGATDALGFLALGNAFTSVMTGNMVLFGVATAHGQGSQMLLTAVAIGAFVTGAATGARLAGTAAPGDSVWPRPVTLALAVELTILSAVSVAWWGFAAEPPPGAYLPMLAAAAAALGVQSSAIQRFGVPGLSTTYLTGTLTTVVARLAHGHGVRAVRHSVLVLLGLVVGAAATATVLATAPLLAPVLLLGSVGSVLGVVLLRRELMHGPAAAATDER